MFKQITKIITIILISVVMLTSVAQARGGGRGGRGGGGMMGGFGGGGGMMGGDMMGGDMMGGRGFNPQPTIDMNDFRTNVLLTYLADANGTKVDPNTLDETTLRTLYNQIVRGDRDVIDTSRFAELTQVSGTVLGQGILDPNDDELIQVNLNGLSINAIIDLLIEWTGKAVLPSNESMGLTITVYSPARMKRSEALNLLYSAMRQQGFVAETRNNIIYIKPVSTGARYVDLLDDETDLKMLDPMEEFRKIFRVKNYSASTMGQLILPFLNPTGSVTAEETTQTLMVTDTAETLIQVKQIIDRFDNTLAGTTTELLKVQHSDPTEMADMIAMIMTSNITSSGMLGGMNMGGMMGGMMQQTGRTNTRTTTTNRNDRGRTNDRNDRGRTSNPTSMMSMGMMGAASASASTIGTGKPEPQLIPDAVNKVIIATATPEDMATIKSWLVLLDTENKVVWNPAELTSLDKNQVVQKIYNLQYNTPDRLAQILEPLLTENGYLTAEQDTGTLLIRDTVGTLLQLEDIIREFDKEESNPEEQQIFVIERGDPREIVEIINTILSGSATGAGTRTTTGFGGNTGRTNNTRTNTRTTNTRNTGRTGGGGFGF